MPDSRSLKQCCQSLTLWAGLMACLLSGLLCGQGAVAGTTTARVQPPDDTTQSGLQNLWFGTHGPTEASRELFRALARSTEHGLPPARYDLVSLQSLWGRWQRLRQIHRLAGHYEAEPDPMASFERAVQLGELEAELEAGFDRAFSRLASDLGRGMLDAKRIQTRLFRPQPDVDTEALRAQVRQGRSTVTQALDSVTPPHPQYRALVARMQSLLAERAAGRQRASIRTDRAWRAGEQGVPVEQLKQRLMQTGELTADTPITPWFDAYTLVALQAFQRRHGLGDSGVLGPKTVQALNTSVHKEIEYAAMSMERWRWMPRELGQRHILVNLPDYRVVMMNGDQKILDMPAVVGKPEFGTPVFSRDMSYLDVNPTWTVPASITNRELIPMERSNPGYLEAQGFEFLERIDNRYQLVDAQQIPIEAFELDPFPYLLRQKPGPKNALGRMKFMMPNHHAIYLHDTLSKHLFELDDRAYSHGCVRISQPDRLAATLMLIDGRDQSYIDTTLHAANTRRVNLRSPVPTHLAYYTHWVDAEGKWQARPDVYEYNPALLRALREVSQVAMNDRKPRHSTHPAAG